LVERLRRTRDELKADATNGERARVFLSKLVEDLDSLRAALLGLGVCERRRGQLGDQARPQDHRKRTTISSLGQDGSLDVLVAVGVLLEDDLPCPVGGLETTELEEDVSCSRIE